MPVSSTVHLEPEHVARPVSWLGPWFEQSYVQLAPVTQAAPAFGIVAGHAPPSRAPASCVAASGAGQTVPMSCTFQVPSHVARPGVLSQP